MKGDRIIFHCDCNSFYASVELLKFPELENKPVAVAGGEDDRHGIILAKNEEAKKYNVKTAETIWQAKNKCPELILLSPHHSEYIKYSEIINEIYSNYTDRVEPFGIDESWLDVSGSWSLFGNSAVEVADKLREDVRQRTGLTISAGVSFNKIFAKLASDYKKPNATTLFSIDNYKEVVWPLSVSALLYVGKKTKKVLNELGIETIGQLAFADENLLKQVLGKQGVQLKQYAMGEDEAAVAYYGEREPVKSVGNGQTFKRNLLGFKDVRIAVGALAEEVAQRLRQQKLYATNIQITIKNPEFKTISRQKNLPFATNLSKDLIDAAMELIRDNWELSKPIRMITVTAQQLTEVQFAAQTSFLDETIGVNVKRASLEKSMDKIREKYGSTAILQAGALHNDIGIEGRAKTKE